MDGQHPGREPSNLVAEPGKRAGPPRETPKSNIRNHSPPGAQAGKEAGRRVGWVGWVSWVGWVGWAGWAGWAGLAWLAGLAGLGWVGWV